MQNWHFIWNALFFPFLKINKNSLTFNSVRNLFQSSIWILRQKFQQYKDFLFLFQFPKSSCCLLTPRFWLRLWVKWAFPLKSFSLSQRWLYSVYYWHSKGKKVLIMLGKKKVLVWRLAQKWNFSLNTANPRCSAPMNPAPRVWLHKTNPPSPTALVCSPIYLLCFKGFMAAHKKLSPSLETSFHLSPSLLSRNGVVKLSEGFSSPQPDNGMAFGHCHRNIVLCCLFTTAPWWWYSPCSSSCVFPPAGFQWEYSNPAKKGA